MNRAKGDRTRAQIIEGAVRALSATGVLGVTTRRIATEAGVQLATLHYHFDSKSALLLAVLDSMIDEMTRERRDEVKTSKDIHDCIRQVLQSTWRWIARTRVLQIVQYELTLYALREGADWLAERQYDAYVQIYYDLLRRAPRGDDELTDEECKAVAHFMLAGVDGIILQELAKPNRARSKRTVEALIGATQGYARSLREARAPAKDKASLGRLISI
jgi:AcrR family transcriptional regulator